MASEFSIEQRKVRDFPKDRMQVLRMRPGLNILAEILEDNTGNLGKFVILLRAEDHSHTAA